MVTCQSGENFIFQLPTFLCAMASARKFSPDDRVFAWDGQAFFRFVGGSGVGVGGVGVGGVGGFQCLTSFWFGSGQGKSKISFIGVGGGGGGDGCRGCGGGDGGGDDGGGDGGCSGRWRQQ